MSNVCLLDAPIASFSRQRPYCQGLSLRSPLNAHPHLQVLGQWKGGPIWIIQAVPHGQRPDYQALTEKPCSQIWLQWEAPVFLRNISSQGVELNVRSTGIWGQNLV